MSEKENPMLNPGENFDDQTKVACLSGFLETMKMLMKNGFGPKDICDSLFVERNI